MIGSKGRTATRQWIAVRVVGALAIPALWTVLSEGHVVPAWALPQPQAVVAALTERSGLLPGDFALTILRALVGYGIGLGTGITAVLLMGLSVSLRTVTVPVVEILRPIPALALAPFAMLWFGIGPLAIVSLSAWGVFFVMVIIGLEALRSVPLIHIRAAQSLGADQPTVYRSIVLPSLVPSLMGGMRVALVLAFNLTILQEFSVASGGLGDLIMRGYRYLHPAQLLAGVLCVLFAVVVLDLAFIAFRSRFLSWID